MSSVPTVRSLDELNNLIAKRERLLAKRLDWEPSQRRETLVRKLHNRLARNYAQRDELTGQPQPFDEFNIRLEIQEIGDNRLGMIHVDIFDSPLDDSFAGGDPLIMKAAFKAGKGMDENGRTWGGRGRTINATLTDANYWDGELEQTISMGSRRLANIFENFDTGTITLYSTGMQQIHSQDFYELC